MKKIIAAISAALFVLSILAGCAEKPVVPVTTEQTAAPETEVRTEPVTEAPVIEEDNFAGTPAYTTDGDKIIVDGVAYPNTKNMTMGVTYAVDDVGREVMTNAGQYRTDKYVGIFYFLWIGEHGDSGELDMTKIMEAGGEAAKKGNYSGWGPVGAMHFWGEPLYGYYYSKDTWVMRKHIEELTLANIDFVYIDITNGPTYMTNAKNLMKIMHEFNEQGYNAPKIVFYTHTSSPSVVKTIYDGIYKNDYMPDTWLMLDGKPAVIAYEGDCKSALKQEIFDFFSYREPQWPNEAQKKNGWPWMDFTRPQRVFPTLDGTPECINVSVAQHPQIRFGDSVLYGETANRGRAFHDGMNDPAPDAYTKCYNFIEQFERALEADVPVTLVTGWNEWIAGRWPGTPERPILFVDCANYEYSRDIEMMRGGYFDNYYKTLCEYAARLKGLPDEAILGAGGSLTFPGYPDGTFARDAEGYGTRYVNRTGRYGIRSVDVRREDDSLLFALRADRPIDPDDAGGTFLRLWVKNADGGEIPDNAMRRTVLTDTVEVRVPLSAVTGPAVDFKAADSREEIRSPEDFYDHGDVLPLGYAWYRVVLGREGKQN